MCKSIQEQMAKIRRETFKQFLIEHDYPEYQVEETLPYLKDCKSYQDFVKEINNLWVEFSSNVVCESC